MKWFWAVMAQLSQVELSMFLKFVWGQSRLPDPSKAKNFTLLVCAILGGFLLLLNNDAYFVLLQKLHRENPDQSLPQAATCFMTLKLPPYSSQAILKEKLLYAITNCFAIDNA